MKNVRCVGGGMVAHDPAPFGLGPTHYERATKGEPCGWKGERMLLWNPTQDLHLLTPNKPCPRCGGQVELIPQDGES